MDIRNRFAILLHDIIGDSDQLGAILGAFDQAISESQLPAVRDEQNEVLKAYLVSLGASGRTVETMKGYTIYLNKFISTVGKSVEQVTPFDIRAYIVKYKQRGVCDATLDHVRICLKGFFEWCFNEGLIPKNPMVNIPKIKFVEEKKPALSPLQLERLREGVKDDLRLSALVEAMYSSGCRVSEILSIKLEDIDWKATPVSAHIIGKGKKPATVYFSNKAVLLMQKYIQNRRHESEYLFCNERGGGKMKKANVEKIFRSLRIEAGATFLTPHTLRRTLATDIADTASIRTVRQVLRHSNINTTMRYVQDDEDAPRRLYGRVVK